MTNYQQKYELHYRISCQANDLILKMVRNAMTYNNRMNLQKYGALPMQFHGPPHSIAHHHLCWLLRFPPHPTPTSTAIGLIVCFEIRPALSVN